MIYFQPTLVNSQTIAKMRQRRDRETEREREKERKEDVYISEDMILFNASMVSQDYDNYFCKFQINLTAPYVQIILHNTYLFKFLIRN